jgi:hypothetical protein
VNDVDPVMMQEANDREEARWIQRRTKGKGRGRETGAAKLRAKPRIGIRWADRKDVATTPTQLLGELQDHALGPPRLTAFAQQGDSLRGKLRDRHRW